MMALFLFNGIVTRWCFIAGFAGTYRKIHSNLPVHIKDTSLRSQADFHMFLSVLLQNFIVIVYEKVFIPWNGGRLGTVGLLFPSCGARGGRFQMVNVHTVFLLPGTTQEKQWHRH